MFFNDNSLKLEIVVNGHLVAFPREIPILPVLSIAFVKPVLKEESKVVEVYLSSDPGWPALISGLQFHCLQGPPSMSMDFFETRADYTSPKAGQFRVECRADWDSSSQMGLGLRYELSGQSVSLDATQYVSGYLSVAARLVGSSGVQVWPLPEGLGKEALHCRYEREGGGLQYSRLHVSGPLGACALPVLNAGRQPSKMQLAIVRLSASVTDLEEQLSWSTWVRVAASLPGESIAELKAPSVPVPTPGLIAATPAFIGAQDCIAGSFGRPGLGVIALSGFNLSASTQVYARESVQGELGLPALLNCTVLSERTAYCHSLRELAC